MRTPGGRTRSGQVVVFDPRRDIAVLRVPGLKAPTLRFHRAALEADVSRSFFRARFNRDPTVPKGMFSACATSS